VGSQGSNLEWQCVLFASNFLYFMYFSYSELLNWEDWKRLQLLQHMQVIFFGFISCLTVCLTCSLVANMRIALFFLSVLESSFPPTFLPWHFVVFNMQFS
jgi:hypothetical protein